MSKRVVQFVVGILIFAPALWAQNLNITGRGLTYLSSSLPGTNIGQTITWEIAQLLPGERITIELRARVTACAELFNRADVRFGCADGSICYDTAPAGRTATASISLIVPTPLLEFTPPTILVPYCTTTPITITIPITNSGDGSAYDVRLCVDMRPLQISNVQGGATYDGRCFRIPDIPLKFGTFGIDYGPAGPPTIFLCCGCPLSATTARTLRIICGGLVTTSRTATPSIQEKCGRIKYTNIYTFADQPALDVVNFDELVFIEHANNLQDYIDGTLEIRVDGTPASPLIVNDGTPTGPLEIRGINYPGSVRGRVLVISYELMLTPDSLPTLCPATHSFHSWSTLDLCGESCRFLDAALVQVVTPAMSVQVDGLPALVDPCATYTVTITLTKTSAAAPRNVLESTRATWPGGQSTADPRGAPGPKLIWSLGATLDAGETLVLVFTALITEETPRGKVLCNQMWAFGVDERNRPIPSDQSARIPADNDPDDHASPLAQWGPWPGIPLLGFGILGLVGLSSWSRKKWLGLFLLGIGLIAQAQADPVWIRVLVIPVEGGTVVGDGLYPSGATVRLLAIPSAEHQFVGWYEDQTLISTKLVLEFAATRDRVLEARFEPIPVLVILGGSWQGAVRFIPTPAIERSALDLRFAIRYKGVKWVARTFAGFEDGRWRTLHFHGSARLGKISAGGFLTFDPAVTAYRAAHLSLIIHTPELITSLRLSHAIMGIPPRPRLLFVLTLRSDLLSFITQFGEKGGGITFHDALVTVSPMEICCGITASSILHYTRDRGFSYFRLTITDLIPLCCGLSLGVTVKFAPRSKEVSLLPRWIAPCEPCLTVYGDVLWEPATSTLHGIAVYGFKIYCCLGGPCPGAPIPSPYLELVTAFDPLRMPGGFREAEFQYSKFGVCGPGCCGGSYFLETTVFFTSARGAALGISRILVNAGVPLLPGFLAEARLAVDVIGGVSTLSVGWDLRF